MTTHLECPREQDVLELVAIEQWPHRADAELRAHVTTCAACQDLALAASAVVELREATSPTVRVPDARVVWYRAQMRAREDAARRANRPMVWVQVAALACVVAAVVTWSLAGASGLGDLWMWVRQATPDTSAESFRAVASSASTAASPFIYWAGALLLGWVAIASAVVYVTNLADREPK